MSKQNPLLTYLRPSSLMMGVGSVLAGTACAGLRGNTEYLPATLCILFVIFAQMAGNFYYRYYDVAHACGSYIDKQIATHSAKGESIFLKEGSFGALMLAAIVGLSIAGMTGWFFLVIGIIIVIVGWLTMGGSMPLLRTPYGIICPFILFGPLCVFPTSLFQSMHEAANPLNWFDVTPSLYMSIVMGLMCVNATMLYSYANYYQDKRNSKDTFVVVVGRKNTRLVFLANSIIYTVVTVFMCLQLNLPLNGLDMVPSTICFILDIYIWWKMKTLPRYKLSDLIIIGNLNVLIMGLLSFFIFEFTGIPDDSTLTFFGI